MKINFNQLDNSKKSVQFLNGIYSLESDRKSAWIWTSNEVSGICSNVEFVTIKALSEINNILNFDDNKMEIRSDSLNIIKLNLSGKSDFKFDLKDIFNVPNDSRNLGIKIIGILIDGEIIF